MACERLKPIAVSCFTASTSSSTAGEEVLSGSSCGGVSSWAGGSTGSCCCFFFLPKGSRILSLECLGGGSLGFSYPSFDDDEDLALGEATRGGGDFGRGDGEIGRVARGDDVVGVLTTGNGFGDSGSFGDTTLASKDNGGLESKPAKASSNDGPEVLCEIGLAAVDAERTGTGVAGLIGSGA